MPWAVLREVVFELALARIVSEHLEAAGLEEPRRLLTPLVLQREWDEEEERGVGYLFLPAEEWSVACASVLRVNQGGQAA